jgi:hypothetical protein
MPNGVLPVGASVHDTLPINHTLPIGHSIPLSSSGVVPVGASVHDTVPINHPINHGIQTALTGLDIDVSDNDALLDSKHTLMLKADMAQAATEWMNHIDNPNHTPINILINITDDDENHPRLDGKPAFLMSTGTGANATLESAVEYKLENGADPTTGMEGNPKLSDGAQADVVININSHYLDSTGWLDPNPASGSDWVPAHMVDMVSELAHEFGHGLGIGTTSSLNTTTGTFGAGEKTTWESLLDIEKSSTGLEDFLHPGHTRIGHTYFIGSHAEKEHGGPVVVTTNTPEENYGHLGNHLSDATDPKTGVADVMYGVSFYEGQRYEVSDLDVAILQDLGYHTKGRETVPKDTYISEITHPTPFGETVPKDALISEITHPTSFDIHSLAGSGGFSTAHPDAALGQVGHGAGGNIFTENLAHAIDAVIGQVGHGAGGNIFTENLAHAIDAVIGQIGHGAGGQAVTDNAQGLGGFSTSIDPPSAGLGNGAFWDQVAEALSHVTTAGFPPAADAAPLTTPQVGELTQLDLTHHGNLGDVVSSAIHDPVVMQAPDSGIHISASDIHPDLQDHGMASAAAAVNLQPLPAPDVLIDYGAVAASPHYDYHLG